MMYALFSRKETLLIQVSVSKVFAPFVVMCFFTQNLRELFSK